MPAKLLADVSAIDLSRAAHTIEEIRETNPQRFEMEQLSYIAATDLEDGYTIAVREIGADEFWCRGHIPGRPIFPGVLMVETAAQVCSWHYHKAAPEDTRFFGFGGIDAVKFRGEVTPGDTLIMIAKMVELRSRRAVFDTQALVGDRVVFEGRITGMPM